MMKKKTRFIVLAVCAAVVLAVVIILNNIPLDFVSSSLSAPEEIDTLYITVDPGEGRDETLVTVTDRTEIERICGYLSGARFAWRGPYSGISYHEYEGDYIVAIRINGPEESMFLTSDGFFYTKDTKYHCASTQVSDLFAYLVETCFAE